MISDLGDILYVNPDLLSEIREEGDTLEETLEKYLLAIRDDVESYVDRPIGTCLCLQLINEGILDRGYCPSCMRDVTLQIGRQPNVL